MSKIRAATQLDGGGKHGCRLYLGSNQSIPDSTATIVNWDSESWDTDAFHSVSSNTSRITIPSGLDGLFMFTCGVDYDTNTTGMRAAALLKNGSVFNHFVYGLSAAQGEVIANGTLLDIAAAGDYYECRVIQTSGGALNVMAGATGSCWFSCAFIAA